MAAMPAATLTTCTERPGFMRSMALLLVGLAAGTAGVLVKNTGIATGSITFALLTALALLVNLEKPNRPGPTSRS